MVDTNKRKEIINGLKLIDIHNPPEGITYQYPEIDLKDYDFYLDEHRNWEKIKQQPPVLIYDNTVGFTPEEIISHFTRVQKELEPDGTLRIDWGCETEYGLSDDEKTAHYILTAFSKGNLKKPIGFTDFTISLSSNLDDIDNDYSSCDIEIDYSLDYVSPEFRGLGYGFALAKIRGQVCVDQIDHILRNLKGSDIVLSPIVKSDWVSFGGESLTEISNEEIEVYIDTVGESDDQGIDENNIRQLEFNGGF